VLLFGGLGGGPGCMGLVLGLVSVSRLYRRVFAVFLVGVLGIVGVHSLGFGVCLLLLRRVR